MGNSLFWPPEMSVTQKGKDEYDDKTKQATFSLRVSVILNHLFSKFICGGAEQYAVGVAKVDYRYPNMHSVPAGRAMPECCQRNLDLVAYVGVLHTTCAMYVMLCKSC